MNRLQICVGCLVTLYLLAIQGGNGHFCEFMGSCLHDDDPVLGKDDYIFENLHTREFIEFQMRAYFALKFNFLAIIYLHSIRPSSRDVLTGGEICKTETELLHGYFKDGGNTFCLVLLPELQAVNKAKCCESECCGANTRCKENVFVHHSYLVFCDGFFDDGPIPWPMVISEEGFTPLVGNGTDVDPPAGNGTAPSGNGTTFDFAANGATLFRFPPITGYFAIRNDDFPAVCTCTKCNC